MPETNNNRKWLTMRIGRGTLAFATTTDDGSGIVYEPYVVKSGISMAANLREAFKKADLLLEPPMRVRVMTDTDVLMVPVDMFSEDTIDQMYYHAFPQTAQNAVYHNVLPDLNAVAVFSMNRDLRLVIDDHFRDVKLIAAVSPVWRYLHQRSFTGNRNKLYGYFHEKHIDIFSFQQNRFKFCNTFKAERAHDSLYFLLYVWKQLQLQPEHDELHIVGDIMDSEWLVAELKKYLQNAYVINPSADFNRAQVTEIKGMPYDMQTLFVKGR